MTVEMRKTLLCADHAYRRMLPELLEIMGSPGVAAHLRGLPALSTPSMAVVAEGCLLGHLDRVETESRRRRETLPELARAALPLVDAVRGAVALAPPGDVSRVVRTALDAAEVATGHIPDRVGRADPHPTFVNLLRGVSLITGDAGNPSVRTTGGS